VPAPEGSSWDKAIYFRAQDISFEGVAPPQPAEERRYRDLLWARTDAAFRGFLLAAVLTFPLIIAPFVFVGVAFAHRALNRWLAGNGQLVPAVTLDPSGMPCEIKDGAEAFASGMPRAVSPNDLTLNNARVGSAVSGVNGLILWLAGLIPMCITHVQFDTAGRKKTVRIGKYLFRDERIIRQDGGYCWVIHSPGWPRMVSWLVSERTGSE
jgi:hypothetical protein